MAGDPRYDGSSCERCVDRLIAVIWPKRRLYCSRWRLMEGGRDGVGDKGVTHIVVLT